MRRQMEAAYFAKFLSGIFSQEKKTSFEVLMKKTQPETSNFGKKLILNIKKQSDQE